MAITSAQESPRPASRRCRFCYHGMNGWIVSNCAWAIAACATAGGSRRCRTWRGRRAACRPSRAAAVRRPLHRGCSRCRQSSSGPYGCGRRGPPGASPRAGGGRASRTISTEIAPAGSTASTAQAIASMFPSTSTAVTSRGSSPSWRAGLRQLAGEVTLSELH